VCVQCVSKLEVIATNRSGRSQRHPGAWPYRLNVLHGKGFRKATGLRDCRSDQSDRSSTVSPIGPEMSWSAL
jgi:hypothetical protein